MATARMHVTPIATTLPHLDAALGGGLAPGSLTVVGSRTGLGKTQFCAYLAAQALRQGRDVFVVYTESDLHFVRCTTAAYNDSEQPYSAYYRGQALKKGGVTVSLSPQTKLTSINAFDVAHALNQKDFLQPLEKWAYRNGLLVVDRFQDLLPIPLRCDVDRTQAQQLLKRLKTFARENDIALLLTAFPQITRSRQDDRTLRYEHEFECLADNMITITDALKGQRRPDVSFLHVRRARLRTLSQDVLVRTDLSRTLFEEKTDA